MQPCSFIFWLVVHKLSTNVLKANAEGNLAMYTTHMFKIDSDHLGEAQLLVPF